MRGQDILKTVVTEAILTSAGNQVEEETVKAWVAGLLAWAVPGVGHFYAGRFLRGGILGGVVWVMFLVGINLGGHLYGLMDSSSGFLSYVFGFFDLGAGVPYIVARAAGFATMEQAHLPTAEYGNIYLMCAGLLNYLLALDAFDIVAGRKY